MYTCDNAFIAVGQVKSCQDQKPEQIQVQKSANCENTGSKLQNKLQLVLVISSRALAGRKVVVFYYFSQKLKKC